MCRSFVNISLLAWVAAGLLSCAIGPAQSRWLFGMSSRECWPERGRQVWCDNSLADRDCEIAHAALRYVNNVVRFEAFHWHGRPPKEVTVVPDTQNLLVEAAPDAIGLDPFGEGSRVLARTLLFRSAVNGCVSYVKIRLYVPGRDFTVAGLETAFRHEFAHALGMPHAGNGPQGLMSPVHAMNLDNVVPFSDAELQYLHWAYPVEAP